MVIDIQDKGKAQLINFYLNKVNPQDKRKIVKYINETVDNK